MYFTFLHWYQARTIVCWHKPTSSSLKLAAGCCLEIEKLHDKLKKQQLWMESKDLLGKHPLKKMVYMFMLHIYSMHHTIQSKGDHIRFVLIQDSNTVALMGQPGCQHVKGQSRELKSTVRNIKWTPMTNAHCILYFSYNKLKWIPRLFYTLPFCVYT